MKRRANIGTRDPEAAEAPPSEGADTVRVLRSIAELIGRPFPLPPANSPVEILLKGCREEIEKLLQEAKELNILPRHLLGVLYLTLTPNHGDLLDNSYMVWWGKDTVEDDRILAATAYASLFNRKEELSVLQLIERKDGNGAGWVALFSRDAEPSHSLPNVNFLHIPIPEPDWTPVSFLDKAPMRNLPRSADEKNPAYRHFKFDDYLNADKHRGIFETPLPSEVSVAVSGKVTVRGEPFSKNTNQHDYKRLKDRLSSDPRHRGHIAPMMKYASILQCSPDVLFFKPSPGGRAREKYTGAETGVGFILRNSTPTEDKDLVSCYRVAYKIAGVLGLLHWVVRARLEAESEEARKVAYGIVSHSLRNAIRPSCEMPVEIKRVLRLEEVTFETMPLLAHPGVIPRSVLAHSEALNKQWSRMGPDGENLAETIRAAVLGGWRDKICLEASALDQRVADPRLVLLLIELARNLAKHFKEPAGLLEVASSKMTGFVNVRAKMYANYTFRRDVLDLLERERLGQLHEAGFRRGLEYVWLFLRGMATDNALCTCTYIFGKEAHAKDIAAPLQLIPGKLHIAVQASPEAMTEFDSGDVNLTVPCEIAMIDVNGFDPTI